jgi:hypothetical protein
MGFPIETRNREIQIFIAFGVLTFTSFFSAGYINALGGNVT